MINLRFDSNSAPLKILCIGAHSDDIEIGCGATMAQLVANNMAAEVYWLVLSASGRRISEAKKSAAMIFGESVSLTIDIQEFRNGYFPYTGADIKDYFEKLKSAFEPDVIFTHYQQDRHQDHRVTSDLTWNTFRNHCVLEYEIPKFDGDLGAPSVFVPIQPEYIEKKIEVLTECFPSQADKPWFDDATFRGLMRLRGVECNAKSGYAEAYYARKVCLALNE